MVNQQRLDLFKQEVATTEPGRQTLTTRRALGRVFARGSLAPAMHSGCRLLIDPIRSACWKNRTAPGWRSWCCFARYCELCGRALAQAHARSGDPAQISSYLGSNDTLDRAIASFAEAYADQTERDHAALLSAAHTGRIPIETGVKSR